MITFDIQLDKLMEGVFFTKISTSRKDIESRGVPLSFLNNFVLKTSNYL